MDLPEVWGYFYIRALTFGILLHMAALKSPRGRTGVVGNITHLWPYPSSELYIKKKSIYLILGTKNKQ